MAKPTTSGRVVTGKLLQGADGVWREFPADAFSLENLPRPKSAEKNKPTSNHGRAATEGD